jgi:hypothetical protein
MKHCDECRAEILRRYKHYIPPYTWYELEEMFKRNEKSGQAMKYPRLLFWLLREGAR